MSAGEEGVTVEPVWFGPSERPLFGWLHRPADGRVRGGVVLCPPLGIEFQFSQYSYLLVAHGLAALGFLVVRFDYDGTGNSSGGQHDGSRVAAWTASVRHAVRLARLSGVEWIAGIGLRAGATLLASTASTDGGFDALVLWDPCESGKAFLREQRALHRMANARVGGEPDALEIPGVTLSEEASTELAALQIPWRETLPGRVLVFTDPARTYSRRLVQTLEGEGVQWQGYCQEAAIFDTGAVGYQAPSRVLEQITAWVSAAGNSASKELASAQEVRSRATVATSAGGEPIVEEFVRIGPAGLFGVMTSRGGPRVEDSVAPAPPVLLFLSSAANPQVGPARQWVELARLWATLGLRSIRFDFGGIADSPTPAGRAEHAIYASEVLDDIGEAARFASPGDPRNVILVGLCSGALAALSAAPRLRPRGVIAINPWLTYPGFLPSSAAREHELAIAGSRRLPPPPVAPAEPDGRGWARDRSSLGDRLPPLLWTLVTKAGLGHSPDRFLRPLIRAKVPTLLICGAQESHAARIRTPQLARRLEEIPGARFETVPDLDHGLFSEADRETVRQLATRYLKAIVAATPQPADGVGLPVTAAAKTSTEPRPPCRVDPLKAPR